jgi:hypothetical protein
VGHIGPGDAVHARQAGQRGIGQLGQARVVAARHAFADLLQLGLDQVEVVEQPFGRGRDIAPALRDQRDVVEGAAQRGQVLVDARKEGRAGARLASVFLDRLCTGQAAPVLLEALGAEEFGPDRAGTGA